MATSVDRVGVFLTLKLTMLSALKMFIDYSILQILINYDLDVNDMDKYFRRLE